MAVDVLVAPSAPALVEATEPEVPTAASKMSLGEQAVTAFFVATPLLALVFGIVWYWGEGVHLRDVLLAGALFLVVGHGITVGFHRLLAHRSFVACRPLRLALDVRRLHGLRRRTDRLGGRPPPAPRLLGSTAGTRTHPTASVGALGPSSAGLWHAHVGWLLRHSRTSWERHAPDLLADRDVVVMNALFPLWCVAVARHPVRPRLAPRRLARARRSPRCSGPAGCGSSCCTTSRGASTRCATRSAVGRSAPPIRAATSAALPSSRWASRGTTATTPSRVRLGTACSRDNWTPPRG